MKVIDNHHYGGPTVIIGNMFSNGCVLAHMGDLYDICKKHRVSDVYRDKICETYMSDVVHTVADYWTDIRTCREIIKHNHAGYNAELLTHPSWGIRYTVAEYGNIRHLDILVHDPSHEVRYSVAENGHPEHLNILANDPSKDVGMLARLRLSKINNKDNT